MNVDMARPLALLLLSVPIAIAFAAFARDHANRGRAPRALRIAILTMLIIALAEPVLIRANAVTTTVFVIDRSLSVSAGNQGEIEAWIERAFESAGGDQQAAIVSFASSADVAAAPSDPASLAMDWAVPGGPAGAELTDLESGIALARMLPVQGERRIVLLSDGAENSGDAARQANQAQQDGVPIDVLPLPGVAESDLRIDAINVPSATWAGSAVAVVATISASVAANATIQLVVDRDILVEKQVALDAGLTTFTIEAPNLSAGFHALEVAISSESAVDTFAENNRAAAAIVVRDAPKVMYVASAASDPSLLISALQASGAAVTRNSPSDVPSRLSEIAAFDAIVLDNVAADQLSFDQTAVLETATKELGRGLVIVGGTNAFGPGNYADSALEPVLPVNVKSSDARERPRVALLLIIDRSGSMSYDEGGGSSKIGMAKEAVLQAAGALLDGDTLGVLAFSDEQQWVVPLRTLDGAQSRDEIAVAVQGITASGGTEIFPALQAGFDAIRNADADVRHVVLISDGKSRTGTAESYQKLIADAAVDRTTLSTIAIGNDADTELLQQLSAWGNGRYHFTDRPEDIPNLTLQEARSAGDQSVVRGAFPVIQVNPSPIMVGIDLASMPALDGYDYTEEKPGAQIILTSSRGDPLLAKWQFGLGRVVAWTSDGGADLAITWREWPGFQAFWSNILRWSLPDPEYGLYAVDAERSGPDTVIRISRTDGADGPSSLVVRTVAPDGTVRDGLMLQRVAPGEYQVRVATSMPGAYRVDIPSDDGTIATFGFTMPSSPELRPQPDSQSLLSTIASQTGGRVLSLDDPGAVFATSGGGGTVFQKRIVLWPMFVTMGLLLFLVEIGLRTGFLSRLSPRTRRLG